MYINYKSDFSLLVSFEEGLPDYPWRMLFRTEAAPNILTGEVNASYSGGYIARFDGENYIRAKVVEGSETDILVEFKNHGLQPGELRMEWDIMVQSSLFEDLQQRLVTPKLTPITLVESAGDEVDTTMIPILVPMIKGAKGDPFTYDDFTTAQLAALKGEKGERGEKGETGAAGTAGADGVDGTDGIDGAPFTYDDFTDDQLAALKGERGEKGDKGDKGDPFTYEDLTPEQIASMNQGEKGDTGAKGDDGADGATGAKGDKGDKGDPFTYDDFTADQLAALKGEKGDTGDQGIAGADGAAGAAFTYADFTPSQLAELKGEKGDKGDDGADGAAGAKGDPFTYDDFTSEQLAALKGEPGESGASGTPEALENNTVSINSNGIFTEAKPSTRGGVMDGLIMMLSMNVDIDDAAVGLTGTHECWLDKNYFGESASLSCTYGIDEGGNSVEVIVTINGNDLPSRPIIFSSLYGGTVSGFTMPVCTTILEDNRIKITFLSLGADLMLFAPDYYYS